MILIALMCLLVRIIRFRLNDCIVCLMSFVAPEMNVLWSVNSILDVQPLICSFYLGKTKDNLLSSSNKLRKSQCIFGPILDNIE